MYILNFRTEEISVNFKKVQYFVYQLLKEALDSIILRDFNRGIIRVTVALIQNMLSEHNRGDVIITSDGNLV